MLTDTFHKPGFKMHARILMHLFVAAKDPGVITEPLWDASTAGGAAFASNAEFVAKYASDLLAASFPNMARAQVEASVAKLVAVQPDDGAAAASDKGAGGGAGNGGAPQQSQYSLFKQHLRDFLVLTKTFGDAAAGTFEEEDAAAAAARRAALAAIPGMVGPNELPDDGMGDS